MLTYSTLSLYLVLGVVIDRPCFAPLALSK
jgi:hypothetical protein